MLVYVDDANNTTNTAGTLLYYTSAYALAGNRCLQCNYICLQRQ
jgi:hypothetical protein